MGIPIQRHRRRFMTKNFGQSFGIHTALQRVHYKGIPQRMKFSDIFNQNAFFQKY
jgi:hypothetical protein